MKTKRIKVEFDIEGKNIVNFDSNQKQLMGALKGTKKGGMDHLYDSNGRTNTKYAKKNIYVMLDNIRYLVKVSSALIRKMVFEPFSVSSSLEFVRSEELMYSYICSVTGLMRGFLFPDLGLKRKGITITDAEQISEGLSKLEIGTRSGDKKVKVDDGVGDTTLFNAENVGDIKYRGLMILDMRELQTLSGDGLNGNKAFVADKYEEFIKPKLDSLFPTEVPAPNFHSLIKSPFNVPEYSIMLTNDNMNFLVRETLKNLLNMCVTRSNAYAEIDSVRVRLEGFGEKGEWVDINMSNVESFSFDMAEFYQVTPKIILPEPEPKPVKETAKKNSKTPVTKEKAK